MRRVIKLEHNSVIENKILIYESDDNIKVEVILENENIWLTQDQISKLYNKAKSTINEHIKNIYSEHELLEANTMRKFGNSEFSTKPKNYLIKEELEQLELIVTAFLDLAEARAKRHIPMTMEDW